MTSQLKQIKIVVVGDGAVGKTAAMVTYTTNGFPYDHMPTVFENYAAMVMQDGRPCHLSLWDTAGQEDYDRLRPLSYADTDLFLVLFSTTMPSSYKNVREKWIPELRHHAKRTPIIVAGTKTDLRTNEHEIEKLKQRNQVPITTQKGQELADEVGAEKYMEFSSFTQEGLKQLFIESIRTVLKNEQKPSKKRKSKKHKCNIL